MPMEKIFHAASSRGIANHGWLKSHHSFSFAGYYNPDRMGFGALRVINDDLVAPGHGFGSHPHENMEIISIPLSGRLLHEDNRGNKAEIAAGEIQIMSAGTGIVHSEFNASQDGQTNFLQIWVLPEKQNITPRYHQKKFALAERSNQWQLVVSPLTTDLPGVKINQKAYFSLLNLKEDRSEKYQLYQPDNGVYLFLLSGRLIAAEQELQTRDGLGIIGAEEDIALKAKTDCELLVMEVPM